MEAPRTRVSWEDLEYMLLALICVQPDYGYSLANRARHGFDPFALEVPDSNSKVYQRLDRLKQRGLIEQDHEQTANEVAAVIGSRPHRRNFRITAAGEQALNDFVTGPMPPEPNPSTLYVRLICAKALDRLDAVKAMLDAWQTACLEHFEQMGEPGDPDDTRPGAVVDHLLAHAKYQRIQGQLEFIGVAYAMLGLRSP